MDLPTQEDVSERFGTREKSEYYPVHHPFYLKQILELFAFNVFFQH